MKKIVALLLALLLSCLFAALAEEAGTYASEDLVGGWYGQKLHSNSMQQYVLTLYEDFTGYYIDTLDQDIMAMGVAPEIVWSVDGSKLTVEYLDKTAEFEIVMHNGFLNLMSTTGVNLNYSAPKDEAAENEDAWEAQGEAPEDVYLAEGEQYVVLEEQGVKVTFAGEGTHPTNALNLSVIIENNSEYNIQVKCASVANGWQTNGLYTGGVVNSGAKAKQNVSIFHDDVDFTSYQEIETLQLLFTVVDDYKNELFKKDSAVLHLNGKANSDEAAAETDAFTNENITGEWVEINYRDIIIFDADGNGKSTYIIRKSANVTQSHIDERFTWKISGNSLNVEGRTSTFREDVNGSFDIVQDGDTIRLEKNGLVFIRPPRTTDLKIGDAVKTDMMSFTLTKFDMAQNITVDYWYLPNYLRPCKDGSGYNAGDNNTYALPEFKVVNLDKNPIYGESWEIMIDYNDGYVYYGNSTAPSTEFYIDGAGLSSQKASALTPLVEGEGRAAITVAKALQDDKDAPLKLIVRLPSHEFGIEYFEYDLRAQGSSVDMLKEYTDKVTVKSVQAALNDAGFPCGTPDGAAGKKTKAALSDYQNANGLTVTGTITHETLVSMGLAD